MASRNSQPIGVYLVGTSEMPSIHRLAGTIRISRFLCSGGHHMVGTHPSWRQLAWHVSQEERICVPKAAGYTCSCNRSEYFLCKPVK